MRSLLLLLSAGVVSFVACGDSAGESDSRSPPAQTKAETKPKKQPAARSKTKPMPQPAAKSKEKTCLIRGGASKVEQRDDGLWRGFTDEGALVIKGYGSASEAARVVKAADLIEAEATGRYAVNGRLKGGGSAEAVSIVADCLENG